MKKFTIFLASMCICFTALAATKQSSGHHDALHNGAQHKNVAPTFNPYDSSHFMATGECEYCDLSGDSFWGNHGYFDLYGANLNKATLGGNFTGSDFSYAKMIQTWFRGAFDDPSQITDFSDSDFFNANLSHADLQNANLHGANFNYTKLVYADFYNAILTNADFFGADMSHALLDGADLSGAFITTYQLNQADSICGAILPNGAIGRC